jgi:hypothetical protein
MIDFSVTMKGEETMRGDFFVRLGLAIFLVAFATIGADAATDYTIISNFDTDTPGLPPTTGGLSRPTGIIGLGVLVRTSSNGISTQPLEVDDASCNMSYYGGVYYDLPVAVTSGFLRIDATVALNQLTDGVIFDTAVNFGGASIARLSAENNGTIVDHFGVVLGNYSANAPFRFRAVIDMVTKTWSCVIDDEFNGFGDDQVFHGLDFVNSPAVINQIDLVAPTLFGSFSACTGSRIVAYDDIFITNSARLFADGFETGGTGAWSATVP